MEKELLKNIESEGLAKMIIARRNEQWVSMEDLVSHGFHRNLLHILEDMEMIIVKQHATSPIMKLTARGIQLVVKYVRGHL